MKNKKLESESIENLFLKGQQVPDPVFFCSIEPPSLAHQSALEVALAELQREDPSLRVTNDADTGQTVLAGWQHFLSNVCQSIRIFRHGGAPFRHIKRQDTQRI